MLLHELVYDLNLHQKILVCFIMMEKFTGKIDISKFNKYYIIFLNFVGNYYNNVLFLNDENNSC